LEGSTFFPPAPAKNRSGPPAGGIAESSVDQTKLGGPGRRSFTNDYYRETGRRTNVWHEMFLLPLMRNIRSMEAHGKCTLNFLTPNFCNDLKHAVKIHSFFRDCSEIIENQSFLLLASFEEIHRGDYDSENIYWRASQERQV
jgi:hypothetical protein